MKKLTDMIEESKKKKAEKQAESNLSQPSEEGEYQKVIKKMVVGKSQQEPSKGTEKGNQDNADQNKRLYPSLKLNIEEIQKYLGDSNDVIIRHFKIDQPNIKSAVIYIDGLIDKVAVQDFILESLMIDSKEVKNEFIQDPMTLIQDKLLTIGEVSGFDNFTSLLEQLLSGNTVLLFENQTHGFSASTRGWEDRGVTEPSTQSVVRGPKDSFSETLRTNTALIRRRIKDPGLRIETKRIGRITKTDVSFVYINGITNKKIINEVRERLDRIDIDAVLESGYIEELIQDQTMTPFPTVYNTERPDVAAAGLLEGRVVILVDGTPFVLLVPALFIQFFHASEDYYNRTDIVIGVRILRFFAFFLALLTPSAYIAVTTFHQEMLPTPLLISIASQREGIPFPAVIEALIMIFAFEILHEAGIRMPRAIGSAISIVGALVLGEAAVQAGLVSSVMVIVVSLTAISSFAIPTFNMGISVRMIRLILMVLAATFGLFGIIIGLITMVLHLCSLRSFGIPYMSPFAPFIATDQKDAIFRVPWWRMTTRPRLINQKNIDRQQSPKAARPKPPNR